MIELYTDALVNVQLYNVLQCPQIRAGVLQTLHSQISSQARRVAAQIIGKIGAIDLPQVSNIAYKYVHMRCVALHCIAVCAACTYQ
jgi:hypothetical protein